MTIRTVSLILVDTDRPQESAACLYALKLAEMTKAHLAVCIGVPPLFIASATPFAEIGVWVEQENSERRRAAKAACELILAAAALRGVTASSQINADAYDPIFPHLVQFARVSDLSVVQVPDDHKTLQHDLIIELMMTSGVPTIVVPRSWKTTGAIKTAVVAWDGTAPAARAVRDAMPLLEQADVVEIVSVHGEKDLPDQVAGTEIAKHLARHCKQVQTSDLPVQDKNVAATLRQHAHLGRVDLIVMGGYGHSRFSEFVMGGVTRDMLKHVEIPTLLSH